MNEGKKIPVSIYMLNLNHFESTSFQELVNEVRNRINEGNDELIEEYLDINKLTNENVRLFYFNTKNIPKWSKFFGPVLNNKSQLLKIINSVYSFICFIGVEENVFLITGGNAIHKISHLVIPDFGLQIVVRIFKPDSKVIKTVQDRGITGNILGQTKFYRGDQRFSDERKFGKILKQLQAEINKTLLEEVFGFQKKELVRNTSICVAKDSFQISKSVDFKGLLSLTKEISKILKKKPNFSLNKVQIISRRKKENELILEELESKTKDYLFKFCKKGEDVDVDLCHYKFDQFHNATSIRIIIEGGTNIEIERFSTFSDIINALKRNKDYDDRDQEYFNASVLNRIIESYDSEDIRLTRGTIFEHINGEFNFDYKTFFLIDREWYKIEDSFINDLNIECKDILKDSWVEATDFLPFKVNKREKDYNLQYVNKDSFWVFDTITPFNIEVCDILHYKNNNLNFIHVKKGFDNSIRDLSSQILISAKQLQQDLRNELKTIKKLQEMTVKSKIIALKNQVFPSRGLSHLFQGIGTNQINFCLAFVDKGKSDRSLRLNLESFNSNIAKFSLIELKSELQSMGFGFKIIQLNREQ